DGTRVARPEGRRAKDGDRVQHAQGKAAPGALSAIAFCQKVISQARIPVWRLTQGLGIDQVQPGGPMSLNVTFPQLLQLQGVALLALRIMVAIVFGSSGYLHLKDPVGRAKSVELSPGQTAALGGAEALASLSMVTGILIQPAAIGLIALS